ncbi:hypothetical protein F511_20974 [Dorcoceras hygrometricum]|uniref:Uncharacterized protein n=1 Tax=Dorcoceras hygrometricum TaxID=472368 RepID=A0A2Z7ABZ5_9LAMI|nr:hypothetical protein F511_20974 [Dorcoceras hygrometricum]
MEKSGLESAEIRKRANTTTHNAKTTEKSAYVSKSDTNTYRTTNQEGAAHVIKSAGLAMETSKVESVVRNQAEAKLNQLEHSEPAGTIRISYKLLKMTAGTGTVKSNWRSIEEEQFSSKLQCSEIEEISCWIETKRNRESVVMMSSYILEEAMSSKDDVITISKEHCTHLGRRRFSLDKRRKDLYSLSNGYIQTEAYILREAPLKRRLKKRQLGLRLADEKNYRGRTQEDEAVDNHSREELIVVSTAESSLAC